MQGTRLIVTECGDARGASQITKELIHCGARVTNSFGLISGVAASLTQEAVRTFFSRFPNAKVVPDRRRQIPPVPFGRDDWAEVAGTGERANPAGNEAETSPLALTLTKADALHALGLNGEGVRVCVIDTGVDFNHPELQGVAVLGADGKPLAADFTETDLTDTIGHGTAVAGCIAAQGRQVYPIKDEQNGKTVGHTRIKGMAPGVRIMTAKVFDARVPSGYDSAIIAALEWAAANGAHIVNMSLGGSSLPNDGKDPLASAVTALRERGIVVAVAAGNEGSGFGTLQSPGSSPGALTVGASTMFRSFAELGFLAEPDKWTSDQIAAFSSLGPAADGRIKPDIVAPGAYDWGLAPTVGSEEGQTTQLFGGTSQAAPFMAGAAALVFQAYMKANGRFPTPDELAGIVCSTADDLGLPPQMQGAGRVNCLRAVQAVTGEAQAVICSLPAPAVVPPGNEGFVTCQVSNPGPGAVDVALKAIRFLPVGDQNQVFKSQVGTAHSPVHIPFSVAPGTDLLHISLGWPSEDHSPNSPRLMLALYDPDGRFVNYQRPNSSGDIELGKSVDTWVARPAPGTWTARVVLRLGQRDTSLAYSLSIRPHRRIDWDWAEVQSASPDMTQPLAPGESRLMRVRVRVPDTAATGTYLGHIMVGSAVIPFSVVVPITFGGAHARFSGAFEHGYQGSWGNGDWFYHDMAIPAGTHSVVVSLQWPDVDNSVECYLIDPEGRPVVGRANTADILDDGDTDVMGGQIVLANPMAGRWRVAVHSFAFCGRGEPEPYAGMVELGGEMISPRVIQLRVAKGERAPIALQVRNPGRMPLEVQATVQSTAVRLGWMNIGGELVSGVDENGQAVGEGHAVLATVDVPHDARQIGVFLNWDSQDTQVSVSLFDPVAQGDRVTSFGDHGQVVLMESAPVPGKWTIIAGATSPTVQKQTIQVKGSVFVLAPEAVPDVVGGKLTLQPGATGILSLSLNVPSNSGGLAGRIVVTTPDGDRLGEVPFTLETEDAAGSEAAAGTE